LENYSGEMAGPEYKEEGQAIAIAEKVQLCVEKPRVADFASAQRLTGLIVENSCYS
jgi:hypothetical protein